MLISFLPQIEICGSFFIRAAGSVENRSAKKHMLPLWKTFPCLRQGEHMIRLQLCLLALLVRSALGHIDLKFHPRFRLIISVNTAAFIFPASQME